MKVFKVVASLFVILLTLLTAVNFGQSKIINQGKGSFVFNNPELINGKSINVYYYVPANYTNDSPVLFVHHGVSRNSDDYRDQWNEHAERLNSLLVVPEFSEAVFPLDQDYNMGNMFSMAINDSILGTKPKSQWAFSLIEPIFDLVKKETGNNSDGYYMYGHSAGSQFVHRFVLFTPDARCIKAICANAGWYTMIKPDDIYPYGIKGTELKVENLAKVFEKNFVVLLGTDDNDPKHRHLRITPEAMLQGAHRFERGQNFFNQSKEFAAKKGFEFNWEMVFVEGVAHNNKQMSRKAAELLFNQIH